MKEFLRLALLVVAVLLVAIPAQAQQRDLQTGILVVLASGTISPSGGSLTVCRPDHPLNGLSITIPNGAFGEQRTLSVAAAPIATHSFGMQLNPLTDLIKLDFGNLTASETIDIRIPVNLGTISFARGLAYDAVTKTLRDLPVTRIGTGVVSLSLRRDALPFVLSGPPR